MNKKVFYEVPAFFSGVVYSMETLRAIDPSDVIPQEFLKQLAFITDPLNENGTIKLRRQSEVEIRCGDGRSLVLKDEHAQSHTLSPIRTFGGLGGIFDVWIQYLCEKNNVDINDKDEYKLLVEEFSQNIKSVLKRLSLVFHVHTDDAHLDEKEAYSAGCAHLSRLISSNPAFGYFMELMKDVAVVSARSGPHEEVALIITRGKFSMYRGGSEQFFAIDGRIRIKIQELIDEYNSMFDDGSSLYVHENEFMEIYLQTILDTCKALILKEGKTLPILFLDNSHVKRQRIDGNGYISGESQIKVIPSQIENLEQLLRELFEI